MHLTNDASRWQLVCHSFGQDALAANQSDVQLPVAVGESSQAVDSYVAPWYGELVAIAYTLSAAGTAGVFTIGATVNGTENSTTTRTVGTTTEGYKTFAKGTAKVVPGDNVGAEITTDGSWDGTSADLSVQVYALYRMDGFS